jgi:amino acid adenylation domain-containing protein
MADAGIEKTEQPVKKDDLDNLEAYWLQKLGGELPVLDIKLDRSHLGAGTSSSRRVGVKKSASIELEKGLHSKLAGFVSNEAYQNNPTLVTLLAVFKAVLFRYTGQEDMIVGTLAKNARSDRESIDGAGDSSRSVNPIPLRTSLKGNPTVRELLERVSATVEEASHHRDYPFKQLVKLIYGGEHNSQAEDCSPIFQVMFVACDLPNYLSDSTCAQADLLSIADLTAKCDLVTIVSPKAETLEVRCEYDPDSFEPATIQRFLDHFQTMLAGLVTNSAQKLFELPLLTTSEQQQLADWNDTQVDYPQDVCLHKLFEDRVKQIPDAIALDFEGNQLTYRELNSKANQLARYLQSIGVKAEVPVGIFMERSLEMVIAIYGILKAGGAYVPLDPEYPIDRLTFMLEDTQLPAILTQKRLATKLPEHNAETICLDSSWSTIAAESGTDLDSDIEADNLAYIIYTSGSTGKPKGVMNTHRGICNRLLWMLDDFRSIERDRVIQKTPFSFDVSVWEFFWPLLVGARLVVAKPGGHRDAGYLINLIVQQEITTLHLVPSMLQIFLEHKDVSQCRSLQRVMCSGEALPYELQESFFNCLDAELHNLYGPTEAAVEVTYWQCQPHSDLHVVPIGRPIANTQMYVLDACMQPVPIGIMGELHIGGVQVARGYLNRASLTAEKFIPDPFSDRPHARLYKTGDLARYLKDGSIEYLGRIDHQVKIRGFRVELGEIESVLIQHPNVQKSLVVVREDRPGDRRLVAYIVPPAPEQVPTPTELRQFLKVRLPEHMVPSAYVLLEEIPLTSSGKADRRALPAPNYATQADEDTYVAPRNEIELKLTKIWERILGTQPIGIKDNFFDLGGYSLLAIRLFTDIDKELRKNLPMPVIFQAPTIAQLAEVLLADAGSDTHNSRNGAIASGSVLVEIQPNGSKPPIFCCVPAGSVQYASLSRLLGADRPFYVLRQPGLDIKQAATYNRVEELAVHYLREIRNIQPEGPYLLLGHCLGGSVAFEIAQQLHSQGQKVTMLALVNSTAPKSLSHTSKGNKFADLRKKLIFHWQKSSTLSPAQMIVRTVELTKAALNRLYYKIYPHGKLLPHALQYYHAIELSSQLVSSYVPSVYAGKSILFRSSEGIGDTSSDLGWNSLFAEGLEVYPLPGHLLDVLNEPSVSVLAEQLDNCIGGIESNLK